VPKLAWKEVEYKKEGGTMRGRYWSVLFVFVLCFSLLATQGMAQEEATDITKDVLTGPGNVSITTEKDILMSFGAQARIIPTSETNWDFGMSDEADGFLKVYSADPGSPGTWGDVLQENLLADSFFKNHLNESGWVNNNYIRTEGRLYFNAMPKDRRWSFYSALEFDRPLDTQVVDERGGRDAKTSNYGLERLHGTMALPGNMRLHAGWDVWGLDVNDGGGLVYGDDNPGFWLTGDYGDLSFNVGYFKLHEYNFQSKSGYDPFVEGNFEDRKDADRDLYAGYLTYTVDDQHKIQPFYAYDHIRHAPVTDPIYYFSGGNYGIGTNETAKTDSHHVGAYYTGEFGIFEVFGEGVYQFGTADDTGLADNTDVTGTPYSEYNDFDISAFAFAGNVAVELEDFVGFSLKPHVGGLYTSGDDDPNDDELGGYTGVENAQRFSKYWGGENTIVGDTNLVTGSLLYGYLPELYGNGTPVFTGGLENAVGFGGGRGDNPGLSMSSVGVTAKPKKFIIYRTNVNSFWWNEDFRVQSFNDPLNFGTFPAVEPNVTTIDAGYAGTEWDNELTFAFSEYTFVKGQCSFFFPGGGIEDVTEARGAKSDDIASRIAAELIWKF
jgi:hypothetical protein